MQDDTPPIGAWVIMLLATMATNGFVFLVCRSAGFDLVQSMLVAWVLGAPALLLVLGLYAFASEVRRGVRS